MTVQYIYINYGSEKSVKEQMDLCAAAPDTAETETSHKVRLHIGRDLIVEFSGTEIGGKKGDATLEPNPPIGAPIGGAAAVPGLEAMRETHLIEMERRLETERRLEWLVREVVMARDSLIQGIHLQTRDILNAALTKLHR